MSEKVPESRRVRPTKKVYSHVMRGMTRLGAAWVVALACTTAGSVHAQVAQRQTPPMQAGDEVTRRVEAALSAGIEPAGATESIVALGAEGERALIAVFERGEAPRYVRLRALGTLGAFETESAARYLESLVRRSAREEPSLGDLHPARSPLVLRRALDGLRTSAKRTKVKLDLPPITACLAHEDAHVRKSAAELLATLGDGAEIDRALQKRLASEPSKMVRGSLSRALTDRSARLAAPRSADPEIGSPPR